MTTTKPLPPTGAYPAHRAPKAPPPVHILLDGAWLRDWQARMAWTQLEAAVALGMSLATYKRMFVDGPSRLQELACKALETGLT